ncbi:MAG: adenosine deaminase [Chloroflexota bacterium]|nr:adenosine deaminase [Chloroflexota bacterium]
MTRAEYIQAAPKAELHLHLQGAVRPTTLLELARRHRVPVPAASIHEFNAWFRFQDFPHFAEVNAVLRACLVEPADLELVVCELGADLAQQNVRYAEVSFTPGPEVWSGRHRTDFLLGLANGRQEVLRRFGTQINFVFDIPRRTVRLYPEMHLIDFATNAAIDGKHDGVVALGLSGTELGNPPEPFGVWFEQALGAGLHSAPHAGETDGPASVWGALRALGAERIGHGVRAVEDPALIGYLVEHAIPLEVCPTSNLRLGLYAGLADHPLPALHAAGVPVTVNTDTPALFGTTIVGEMSLLETEFGLDADSIDEILLNGARASFLPAERREALVAAFQAELDTLKQTSVPGG